MMMWAATLLFFGTVNGVQANAASVTVGATVTVTVTGSNPCGAAHVNYGDGTAITYAITGLPTSHSHKYEKPGAYTIVARGMGNCDGEASTKIDVKGPPPPPPTPAPPRETAEITAVTFPFPAIVRQPASIDVQGVGRCTYVVDFGDGNQQEFRGPLPRRVTHTYAVVETYTVIVTPTAPCVGKFTHKLQVMPPPATPAPPAPAPPRVVAEITAVTFPFPAIVRQPTSIDVQGIGRCTYVVDYGDGNQQEFTGPLPRRVTHTYAVAETYTVVVTPTAPCVGKFTHTLQVMPRGGPRITGLRFNPSPARPRERVTFMIDGTGTCTYTIDFGDGNQEERSKLLGDRVTHVYSGSGTYTIVVTAGAGCTGSARRNLTVL
jgi:PKD repeat protein